MSFWSNARETEFAQAELGQCWWFESDPLLYPSALLATGADTFVARLGCTDRDGANMRVYAYHFAVTRYGSMALRGEPVLLYSFALTGDAPDSAQSPPFASAPNANGPFAGSDKIWQVQDPETGDVLHWDPAHADITAGMPGVYSASGSGDGAQLGPAARFRNLPVLTNATSSAAGAVGCNVVIFAELGNAADGSAPSLFLRASNEADKTCPSTLGSPTLADEEAVCVALQGGSGSVECAGDGSLVDMDSSFNEVPLYQTLYYDVHGKPTVDLRDALYGLHCVDTMVCHFSARPPLPEGPVLETATDEVDTVYSILLSLVTSFPNAQQYPPFSLLTGTPTAPPTA